jgi:predicted tellurium resistance membrane protein TerC
MAQYFTLNALGSFATLTFLEIVLSVDNIVFVALAVDRLPKARRRLGRQLGLGLALAFRIALLSGLVWLSRLNLILIHAFGRAITVKDAVLIGGGAFLIYKSLGEIQADLARAGRTPPKPRPPAGLLAVILEIGLINLVFSLDSVITAIGLANQLPVMIAAVAVATFLMMAAAGPVGGFIERRPTTKMLGLAFILLVGVALIGDGIGLPIPRGLLYAAIGFSLLVETLNSFRAAANGGG